MAGRPTSVAGLYLQELLAKFPDAPALTLAKKAYRECPQMWASLESCRNAVRYHLGSLGSKNRRGLSDKRFMREPRKAGWSDVIPEALVQLPDWKAEVIEGPQRVLLLNDIHIPFHDPEALEVALEHGLTQRPTMVILNGDIADHYSCSEYVKDPRVRDFPKEVLAVKQFLSGLRKRLGKACRIVYKMGNHEERYNRMLVHRSPDLLGIPDFEWSSVFGLAENKIELVEHKRPIRLGKLNVIHGHEYTFAISNPVNAARGLFLRGKTHAICGHFHQSSNHSEKNLDGTVISTWSIGALCDLHPEYRPLNNWNHGFAFVEIEKSGAFHVESLRVLNGKAW